ncbi:MAG: uL30 family ribosomal protein [Candidatus Woesearchaeota archaeon]|jgi:large subunit ribosomal protein L30
MEQKNVAVILIRSLCKVEQPVKDTLTKLRLSRKQHCVVYPVNPQIMGMVEKVRDLVTYGYIDDETHALLKEKRGEKDPKNEKELKNLFRLNSPKGGYERKGIKLPYTAGGVLGFRDDINKLIRKMI